MHATREGRVGEGKHDRPRQEASIPGREPAPGDEVEPGTQGAAGERIVCVTPGTSHRVARRFSNEKEIEKQQVKEASPAQ